MINKTELFLAACTLFPCQQLLHAEERNQRPNIIYILMDDLGYGDLQCYGQQKIETPNIDNLRKQGMKFNQHYSGSPVSAPSRCVLLTGKHTGHAQIRGNDELGARGAVNNHDSMYVHKELEGQYPLKAGTYTLGRMMQDAGYTTGCFGKWGLGYPGSEGTPDKQGFDRFYGYNCQRQAHTYYPPFLYNDNERVYLKNVVRSPHFTKLDKGADIYDVKSYAKFNQKEYANDLIFEALVEFVKQQKKAPFFAMWTTPLPHVSLQAPEKWVNYYLDKFGDEEPYTGKKGYMPCRYPRATYAAMVSYFDEQVGMLIEMLKKEGIYDNTLVVFTSDNGPTFNGGTDSPWFNSGGLFKSEYGWGKCFLHEGGIRVPAIYSWPNVIKAGSETDHICASYDVMATLAEIINVECPPTDGISFFPTLSGKDNVQKEHKYLYWEFPEMTGSKAVRWGKWKAIWKDIKEGNQMMELYDLENDIQELNNIADKHPDIVKEIKRMMEESTVEPENKRFKL